MSGITISTPPAPAAAPNATPVETTPTITGGVQVTPGTPTTTPAAPAADPNRPAWLPEKFKTPEELAASYKELETKLGTSKAPETPAAPAAGTIEASGLDLNAIADEFSKANGALSEATTTALKAKGLTVDNVKAYVDGQAALGNQVRAEFVQIAGSEEAMTATLEWARDKNNIPEADAKAYDAAVQRGDQTVAKMLWQNIVSRYQAVNGKDPAFVSGSTVPGQGGIKPFANIEQQMLAQSDPRYAVDPAYREEVYRRIAASSY